ncbi:MalM family protein [Vibrio sp. SCSIO 43136]|uniref:MalM family protein n=1 Tax=Vibrio sp. SCSIO 43136 TaxID=2819101 RepID=UPI0020763E81|nr:MalM family protein [Vibrio sp. SCSIO 43136]USD67629.1 maltose-binding protein [Vibrio sp. SCSIO 43136]
MKNLLISSISFFSLIGCTSAVDVSTAPQHAEMKEVSTLQSINWNEIAPEGVFTFTISEGSQKYTSDGIDSLVGGFSIDNIGAPLRMELTSEMKDLSVFVPNLALYDQNFELIKSYSSKVFDYDRNDFIAGEVLQGEVVLAFPAQVTKIYGLIYTTDKDLAETTEVIHPAKAFAIAKRVDQPTIADPVVAHNTYGTVIIDVETVDGSEFKRELYYGDKTKIANAANSSSVATSIVSPQPETHSFYISSIESAVAADDIPKALSLLDEAKALNIEGAQEAFVKAVNKK